MSATSILSVYQRSSGRLANGLAARPGRGTFFTVEMIEEDGTTLEYEVYFRLTKPGKKKNLKLYIESAYIPRSPEQYRNRKRKISFAVIVYNVKHGRPIRA